MGLSRSAAIVDDRQRLRDRVGPFGGTGQQVVHLAGHLDPAAGQHDEVVADPLEFGYHVRGEHHGKPVRRDRGHQDGHELMAGERIEPASRSSSTSSSGRLARASATRDCCPPESLPHGSGVQHQAVPDGQFNRGSAR
ncbi:MAG TPA: hypothetical protein VJT49_09875 [Amycolatopsis sp.]|uniref:hypothetical protein n=1 Tax=Amycolatopsis sp. TaxID=37632 RepID=UPI002B496C7D|nr:hypothetical protein [Amycolatopsis sp.]HKS45406.1 hypothetical protein [Amycolatopsis sp.]